ncbi:amino acid adenylation domain-containing protein [Streptomyces sp. TRM70308]|uniref:amino acid adenylation domain-containing protein n=1 Tax=Streptomyces sp. TRM70308 TaxID=3131932 RepID=UPI003CFFAE83
MDLISEYSTVIDALRLAAKAHPDREAFVHLPDGEREEGTLTYRQLDEHARAVATALLEQGAEGQRALLLHPVGLDFVTALLGCFYAGVTAVPVPPEDATVRGHDRLEAIIADCTPALALSSSSQPPADSIGAPVLPTDTLTTGPVGEEFADLSGDTVAVLQYTSGSTALPRGVMVTHRNILANCRAMHEAWGEPDGATTVCWLPLHHDMGLFGLVLRSVVLAGRCVLMPPLAFVRRPMRWLRAVARYRAFLSGGPNFGYELCRRRAGAAEIRELDLSSWQVAFNGAEPVRPGTLRAFTDVFAAAGFAQESFAPSYGLAEITLGVSTAAGRHPVRTHTVSRAGLRRDEITAPGGDEDRSELVCCGRPLPGNDVVIADPDTRNAAAEGRVGEIWVSGPSVAAGYWNRPQDTAEVFEAHLSDGRGPYLRTGDLGYLHEGHVVITGRIKDLMIIRGANHYPQDIEETVQAAHPGLRPGCGAAFAHDSGNEERLVVVQEFKPGAEEDVAALCQSVRQSLAVRHGLTPRELVLVRPGQVPKTSSGKIQRRLTRTLLHEDRLRILYRDTEPTAPADDPRAPVAVSAGRLAEQAALVLARSPEEITAAPSLTAAGLDSLRASELQEMLHQELSVRVEVTDLLFGENVEELAARICALPAADTPAPSAVPPVPAGSASEEDAPFPLTPVQQAYLAGRSPDFPLGGVGTHTYQEYDHADLDAERAVEAWQAVVARHPMLRAVVRPDGTQRIAPSSPACAVTVEDVRTSDGAKAEAVLTATRDRMSHQVHDPYSGPLFEIRLTLLPGGSTRIHLSFDLLTLDGRGLLQILREWGEHYHRRGPVAPVPGPTFRDYLLHSPTRHGDVTAQSTALREPAHLPAGPGLPLAKETTSAPPRFKRRSAVLEPDVWQALQARARTRGVTPSALLCAAYSQVLALFSEERPFTLTVTSFQRPPRTMSPEVVGEFTRLLLVPVETSSGSFGEQARKVAGGLAAAMEPGRPDGVTLLREHARAQGQTGAPRPLAPVVFTSLLDDTGGLDWLGEEVFAVSQTPQVWLDHQATEHHGALRLVWDAVDELFPDGLLEEMFSCYRRLLDRIARDGDACWDGAGRELAGLPPLASCEVSPPMPEAGVLLNRLVEARVETSPDAHAVLTPQRSITYRQLGNASRILAHALREAGAHSGDVTAVVLPRGWEQPAAVTGVLAAGGVYVPLDPEAPGPRLHELLEDSTARFAVTTRALDRSLVWPPHVRRLVAEDLWAPGLEETPPPPPETGRAPGDLAYLIYTSGSSGRPKGVAIEHRGAANTVLDVNDRFSLTARDRVLGVTPLTFDLSVYDVFGTLAAGAGLVVPGHEQRGDPAHWHELIDRHRVSVWNSVPALLRLLAEDPAAEGGTWRERLRLLMLSGDWIPVDFAARLRGELPDARLVSLGGATEGSIWSVLYDIGHVDPDWPSIPYGHGMRGQGAHVLDGRLEPRPALVPGPLYLSGAGLAREYWRDPGRTARAFPTHAASGRRLYRTGDIARLLPGGELEILGREDEQIKVQGRRIEPGEIEAALTAHPAVAGAVVGAQGPRDGIRRLVAYARPHPEEAVGEEELHAHLSQRLPRYLVPDAVHLIAEIPLTRNGKIDRTALFDSPGPRPAAPTPGAGAPAADDSTVAQPGEAGRAEQVLTLVARCGEIAAADPARSFSELGMTSMHLIQLTNALQEHFGHRPSVDELYQMRSVQELLDYYDAPARGAGGPGAQAHGPVLADPQQREDFTRQARSRGLHRDGALTLHLPGPSQPEQDEELLRRRSHRTFAAGGVPVAALAQWLACLREHVREGEQPKYAWASAGGLYPVRVCLQIQPGAVAGVAAGLYGYQPREHALELLSEHLPVGEEDHWPENRALHRQAGIAVFLVADLEAVQPLYGELAERYCLLEAGAIAHLLASRAAAAGLGACPVGALSFGEAARHIGLSDRQPLLHTLLAGPASGEEGSRTRQAREEPQSRAPGGGPGPAGGSVPPQSVPRAVRSGELAGRTGLELSSRPATGTVALPPRAVLVTGATGFLGAFVVARLLRSTDAAVYCLVRATGAEQARTRVLRNVAAHGIRIDDAMGERLIGVAGDLSAPHLGLAERGYDRLVRGVDVVVHGGAQVNWLQSYGALEETNVTGTRRVLDFAADGCEKRLLYLSTVAVFPFGGSAPLTEDAPLDHDGLLYGGYPQSKWVAEQLVHSAARQGLNAVVARPGTVTGCSRCGAFNHSSFLDVLVSACLHAGRVPQMDAVLDMAPVDYVARAAVELATVPGTGAGPYHLTNPHPAPLEEVWDHLASLGYRFAREPYETWRQRMLRPGVIEGTALAPFAAYLAGAEEKFLRLPRYDCSRTERHTQAAQWCPPVGRELLATYVDAYRRAGFLPPPSRGASVLAGTGEGTR